MFSRKVYWGTWSFINKSYLVLLFLFVCIIIIKLRSSETELVPAPLQKFIVFKDNYRSGSEPGARELLERVQRASSGAGRVRNLARFGPVRADTPVLVALAGAGAARLQRLLVSLAQVRDVASVLLVVSHARLDDAVDRLVRSVDFCMVMQIYFPRSLQLYPDAFPGPDPGDACVDATDDDLRFCEDRDAVSAEGKHHWWWSAHVVFEELEWARAHTGTVTFLEEDSYVMPDFVHMLRYARRALVDVPEAQLLAFGRPLARGLDRDKLTVDGWRPPYDNGLTFNSTTWRMIRGVAGEFCGHGDTSWSYSLQQALSARGGATMVACLAPRVVSTRVFSSGEQALAQAAALARAAGLFPARVRAVQVRGRAGGVRRGGGAPPAAGGWSSRDELLCFDPLAATLATVAD